MPKWTVVRLRAEAIEDEGWRSATCKCGLRECSVCHEPYIPDPDDPGTCVECGAADASDPIPHGEPLWPERWPCKALHAYKKADATVWESSYQQMPTVAGGYWFANTPPQFYEKVEPRDFNVYGLCDPALKQHSKADFTTIFFFGVGVDTNRYWLELVRERLTPGDRADRIFEMHRKWRPIGFGYEEYGLQSDVAHLKEKMERENYRFPITVLGRTGIWHNQSKPARIRTLLPLATNKRLYFPNPATPSRDPRVVELVRYVIEDEWNKYPASKYDDVLDVMSRMNDPAMSIREPARMTGTYETIRTRPTGASWMSE